MVDTGDSSITLSKWVSHIIERQSEDCVFRSIGFSLLLLLFQSKKTFLLTLGGLFYFPFKKSVGLLLACFYFWSHSAASLGQDILSASSFLFTTVWVSMGLCTVFGQYNPQSLLNRPVFIPVPGSVACFVDLKSCCLLTILNLFPEVLRPLHVTHTRLGPT